VEGAHANACAIPDGTGTHVAKLIRLWLPAIRPRQGLTTLATRNPCDVEPLKINVPTSGRESPLGRQISYSRFEYLVVATKLESGERIAKIVQIPHPKMTRKITVTLR
jgi:hypothetical protein